MKLWSNTVNDVIQNKSELTSNAHNTNNAELFLFSCKKRGFVVVLQLLE